MRRYALTLWTLILLVKLSTGLASAEQITIVHLDNWSGPLAEAMRLIADEFEKEHPHIKIDYQNPGFLAAVWEKAHTMIAGGVAPDVVAVHARTIGQAISSGFALPLNSFMELDGVDLSSTLFPGVLDAAQVNGLIYGVPKDFNPTHLAVNLDFLDQAGLVIPSLGWTTRDFEDYARKLVRHDASGQVIRFAVPLGTLQLNSWAFINGSQIFDRDSRRLELTDDSFVSALEWMSSLVQAGLMSREWGTLEAFGQGLIAFSDQAWLTNVAEYAKIAPFRWAVVYFPKGEAEPTTFLTNHWWVIPQASQHPREAWEWLKFLHTSPKAMEIRARYSIIPGSPEAVERLVEYSEVPAHLSKEQVFTPFLQPTPRIVNEPADADFQRAANGVNLWGVLYDALRTGRDIKVTMQEIEGSMYAIMNETSD